MDYIGGPLDDAFNPPPRSALNLNAFPDLITKSRTIQIRYLLESDSEDDLDNQVSDASRKLATPAGEHDISSNISISHVAGAQLHLIVCIGLAAQRVVPSLSTATGATEAVIRIDGLPIAIYKALSPSVSVLSVSSNLPMTALYNLSRWIMDTITPTSYIETSAKSNSSQTVRCLHATTRKGIQAGPLPSEIHPFSPPNLLSTQTLSSCLMCVAQQSHLTPNTTLSQPTLLLLLPYPHLERSPPQTLNHNSEYRTGNRQELSDLASIWRDDTLRVVHRALDVERAGVTFVVDGVEKVGSDTSQTKSRQSAVDNSMYI
ncbi:hypothetical protein FRB97_005609 [Tulasnella sp. 331]|nr:hypothetical protein FRB97_005609 [Tulasnella sp. 331]